jgi:hypothetical protein
MGIARICDETPEFRHQDGMNIYFPIWSDQWRLDETMAISTGFGRESALTSRIPQTGAIQKSPLPSILHNKYRKSSREILFETGALNAGHLSCGGLASSSRQVTSLSCNYFPRLRFRLQRGHLPSPTKMTAPNPRFLFHHPNVTSKTLQLLSALNAALDVAFSAARVD